MSLVETEQSYSDLLNDRHSILFPYVKFSIEIASKQEFLDDLAWLIVDYIPIECGVCREPFSSAFISSNGKCIRCRLDEDQLVTLRVKQIALFEKMEFENLYYMKPTSGFKSR